MNDYIDALERELILRLRGREQRHAGGSRSRPRLVRLVPILGISGAVAGCVTVLLLTGQSPVKTASAYALPIFQTAPVDAGGRRAELASLVSAGTDLSQARRISTPFGTGYVTSSADGKTVCVAVPDTTDGYGQSCTTASEITSSGFVVSMVSPTASSGPSEVVVLLPAGAEAPVLRYSDGAKRRLPVDHGAASATVSHDARLILTIGGRTSEQSVRAVEPQGAFGFECSDGYVITRRAPSSEASMERACAAHGGPMGMP